MKNRYQPPSIRNVGLELWLNDSKRVASHNGKGYADFKLWFDNGATNAFIMEKTGIKTQNTVREYRSVYEEEQAKAAEIPRLL
jgi:hypothetical protein